MNSESMVEDRITRQIQYQNEIAELEAQHGNDIYQNSTTPIVIWLFEVQAKNTKVGGKKPEAWIPEEVAESIQRFCSERDRDATESIISVATPSIRR